MRKIALLLVLLAACGDAATTTTVPPATLAPTTVPPTTIPVTFDLPTGPDDIVLQLDVGVNQPDPLPVVQYGFPIFTLFGDGRIISTDRDVESGSLPRLIEARVSPEGMQALVALAVDAGLLAPLDDYGDAAIGDADSTRFVLDTGDQQVSFAVYAAGDTFGIDDPVQVAARERLGELRRTLRDWQAVAGEFVTEGPELFTGDGVLVLGYPGGVAAGSELASGIAWDPQTYETRLGPFDCQAITGAEFDTLLPRITNPDASWAVYFRQIFPGERGCEILPDQ